MSVYPQNYYGQSSYNSGYAAPSQNGYLYQYQQPQPPTPAPPVYHLDPVSFRREYTQRLSQLTFNSRPLIQGLSMLAQEYSRFAEIVGQCIESHIRKVSV
ncbi:hypothetical protein BDQ17DRAFT_90534 [Cyathus striatus]|nr:hypothetical protein BDQ17DRAFT_90534 [Cyathus striatus]